MFWRNPRKELPMFEQTDMVTGVLKPLRKIVRRNGGAK